MNTHGYGGKRLSKPISVMTNDPADPKQTLIISGEVRVFAAVTPPYVRLNGRVGETLSTEVTIVPGKDHPFKILSAEPGKKDNIRVALTGEETGGYRLSVTNIKTVKGRYTDTVKLQTDSPVRPVLTIRVYGNLTDTPPPQPGAPS